MVRPALPSLTGETGAGKSILVDALLLASGGRADSSAVRHGAERARDLPPRSTLTGQRGCARLARRAVDRAQRRMHPAPRRDRRDGRGRAYINGQTDAGAIAARARRAPGRRPWSARVPVARAARLPARDLLDTSGGLGRGGRAVARSVARVARRSTPQRRVRAARCATATRGSTCSRHYVTELDALDPRPGEAGELQHERRRGRIAGARLAEGASQLQVCWTRGRRRHRPTLGRVAVGAAAARRRWTRRWATRSGCSTRRTIACREALGASIVTRTSLDADPTRLEVTRVASGGHRGDGAQASRGAGGAAGAARVGCRRSCAELRNVAACRAGARARAAGHALARYVEPRRAALVPRLGAVATRLDRERRPACMQELGMAGGEFVTRVEAHEPPPSSAKHGNDDVEFLVSANPGQPPRPLAKVASGGELSRISLALQVATLQGRPPALSRLRRGRRRRRRCGRARWSDGCSRSSRLRRRCCASRISPQVAAQAEHQVRVTKHSETGATRTPLDGSSDEARVEEIARMLGGATVTERDTRACARNARSRARRTAAVAPRPLLPLARGRGSSRARSGRAGSASGR